MTGPSTSPSAAGQDGERLVTAPRDLLEALVDPDDCWFDHHGGCQAHGYLGLQPGEVCPQQQLKDVLVAVAPDLDRAGYERARRECADDVRAALHPWYDTQDRMQELIERWSSSGRAPAGEEQR